MSPKPATSAASDAPLVVRAAQGREIARASQLFPSTSERPPSNARFLVALKLRPVERIVATLAWWQEDSTLKFLIAHQPGIAAEQAADALVPAMEVLPGFKGGQIEYGRLLAANEDVAPWLAQHGYLPLRTERVLEAPCALVYERVGTFLSRHGSEMPDSWKTEAIRHHLPETVWPLIEPYRLIKFDPLQRFWTTPGASGYDPEFSNILFDAGTPLGVLLARSNPVCLAIDIRVVKPITNRLRALANLALFAHIQRKVTPTTWRVLAFRGDSKDHRETANLARRMGGREVAVRHTYTRASGSAERSQAN